MSSSAQPSTNSSALSSTSSSAQRSTVSSVRQFLTHTWNRPARRNTISSATPSTPPRQRRNARPRSIPRTSRSAPRPARSSALQSTTLSMTLSQRSSAQPVTKQLTRPPMSNNVQQPLRRSANASTVRTSQNVLTFQDRFVSPSRGKFPIRSPKKSVWTYLDRFPSRYELIYVQQDTL